MPCAMLSPSSRHSRPSCASASRTRRATLRPPANSVIQMLRLTPRNHDGQYVARWRIDVSDGLPARPARGRLRQHHPRLHRRGPVQRTRASRSRARSRPRTPRASCAARSSGFRRASTCARRALTDADAGDRRLRQRRRRDAAGRRRARLLHRTARAPARRDGLRHRSDPRRDDGRGSLRAASAASARISPISSSRRARSLGIPARYVGGYFHRDDGVDAAGGRPRLGRGLRARARLGRLRPGQRRSARPTPMCGSRSGSTTSARRRCAAPATAAAAK